MSSSNSTLESNVQHQQQHDNKMNLSDANSVMKIHSQITQGSNKASDENVLKHYNRLMTFFQKQSQKPKKVRKHKVVKRCLKHSLIVLDLRRQELVAMPEAQECTHVRQVYLAANKLSSLPDWFTTTFSNIRLLDLSSNSFRTLPSDIDKLQKLEVINLANNNFEFFPDVLLKLPNLKKIDISRNTLINVPNDIHRMINLVELDISSNQLMSLPEEFMKLKNLARVRIHPNPFLGSERENIVRLTAHLQVIEEREREKQDALDLQLLSSTPNTPMVLGNANGATKRGRSRSMADADSLVNPPSSSDSDTDDDSDAEDNNDDEDDEYEYVDVEDDEPATPMPNNAQRNQNGANSSPSETTNSQLATPQSQQPQPTQSLENVDLLFVRALLNDALFKGSFKAYCMKENSEAKRCIDFWEQVNIKFLKEENEKARSEYGYKLYAYFFDPAKSQNNNNYIPIDDEQLATQLSNDIQDYLEMQKPLTKQVFDDAMKYVETRMIPASRLYKESTAFALVSLKTQIVLSQYDSNKSPSHASGSTPNSSGGAQGNASNGGASSSHMLSKSPSSPSSSGNFLQKKKKKQMRRRKFRDLGNEEEKKKAEQKRIEKFTKDRYNALMEILESERKYVQFMTILWQVYYEPLAAADKKVVTPTNRASIKYSKELAHSLFGSNQSSGNLNALVKDANTPTTPRPQNQTGGDHNLPPGLLTKVFPNNLAAIIDVNKSLVGELEARFSMYESSTPETIYFSIVGDIFIKYAPRLKIYAGYASVYEECNVNIRNAKKKFPTFAAWLEDKKNSEESAGYDLLALLIMPVQRLPRYVLLLKTLLGTTEQDHPDYNYLIEAMDLLGEYATFQNEKVKETNNLTKVSQIAKALKLPSLANGQRKLLHEGELTLMPKHKLVKGFLFDDLLVLQQTKGSGIFKRNVVTEYTLKTAVITGGGSNSFSLQVNSKEKLDFVCADNADKFMWMKCLAEVACSNAPSASKLISASQSAPDLKVELNGRLDMKKNSMPQLTQQEMQKLRMQRRKSVADILGDGFKKALGLKGSSD